MKTRHILLILGGVIGGGLLLGVALGQFSEPDKTYAETTAPAPRASAARRSIDDPATDAARESPYASLSSRPDFDYEEEAWPDDLAEYRYDPAYEDDHDDASRRAYRREYGRDIGWPEDDDNMGDDLARIDNPARSSRDQAEPSTSDTTRSRSTNSGQTNRYGLREPAPAGPPPRRPSSAEPTPPASEPRAAGGQLPAIW